MSGRSDGAAHGRGARQVSPTAPSTTAESFGTPIEESTLRRDRRPSQPSRRSPPVTAEDARARAGRRTRPGPPARYVPTGHLSLSEARPTAPARRQISAPSTYLQPGEAGLTASRIRVGCWSGSARSSLDAAKCLQDRADHFGGRGGREVEADRGRLAEHRVVPADAARQDPEIGPDEHDRLLRTEGVADLPAGARVRVGAVHDRNQAVGPVDPGLVGCEDPRIIQARLLLLWQEQLVPGVTQRCAHLGIPGALGRREDWTGEIQLHAPSIRAFRSLIAMCGRGRPSLPCVVDWAPGDWFGSAMR